MPEIPIIPKYLRGKSARHQRKCDRIGPVTLRYRVASLCPRHCSPDIPCPVCREDHAFSLAHTSNRYTWHTVSSLTFPTNRTGTTSTGCAKRTSKRSTSLGCRSRHTHRCCSLTPSSFDNRTPTVLGNLKGRFIHPSQGFQAIKRPAVVAGLRFCISCLGAKKQGCTWKIRSRCIKFSSVSKNGEYIHLLPVALDPEWNLGGGTSGSSRFCL